MNIWDPNELIGKIVADASGAMVGWVDKTWDSWSREYPGCFLGVKMSDGARTMYFRGINKLLPVYHDHIRNVATTVTLTKTLEDLCHTWNKIIPCGLDSYPVEELLEMPVYDKVNSRVGTVASWVEENGQINTLGVLLDPYICETWHLPYATIYPIEPVHIKNAKGTITLDQTLNELRDYWHHKTAVFFLTSNKEPLTDIFQIQTHRYFEKQDGSIKQSL